MPYLKSKVPKRVIIAGHSLGGGLAQAATAYLFQNFDFSSSPHVLQLVTIGSARFGNPDFAAFVDENFKKLKALSKGYSCRIVYDDDPFPRLGKNLGFHHVQKVAFITKDMKLLIGPELADEEMIGNQIDALKEALLQHTEYLNVFAKMEQDFLGQTARHEIPSQPITEPG
eukprot:gnl/MRDRNA2_/MRDRNA2_28695_c0_seq2.p2 gnl/MRDRNA2_/MRDRNA2_28695_c0~~gnl/MRDRNA2_/MRDRNA2_28695_c0_seq2.p2  ORF type:complete len:171 (+),score=23.91 gnl/MRDRNA2_/MRDRNA2_28695_c0_seq2:214-726(+)